MAQYNRKNEVLKKQYENHLELDERLSETTRLSKLRDIRKFETYTNFKDFKTFSKQQAMGFKDSYKKHSVEYSTLSHTIRNLREFFGWLTQQPKYRSKSKIEAVRVFSLTRKEENIAQRKAYKDAPTLEQVRHVLSSMPTDTEQQMRDKAMIAFVACTGVRVTALMSLKISHIDEHQKLVRQNPAEVDTKFGKYIVTQLFPVGEDIQQIVVDWVRYMKANKLADQNSPLFPAMLSEYKAETGEFTQEHLSTQHISSQTTIRRVFSEAYKNAGLKYYNPHTMRHMLTSLGEKLCNTPEEFKAWSQNLGHSSPLTTFTSYGQVHTHRQCELISSLSR